MQIKNAFYIVNLSPLELLHEIFLNSIVVDISITFACMQSYANFLIHLLRQFEQCECMCEFSAHIGLLN